MNQVINANVDLP